MIDLQTGAITPENLPTLTPHMSHSAFLGIYPESSIRWAHTPEKGKCHYFLNSCLLYDTRCLMALCFDPEEGLVEVRLSVTDRPDTPIEVNGVEAPVAKDWCPQDETATKAANDAFLIQHCDFGKKDRTRNGDLFRKTDFGFVHSFYDAKGCASDIVISYHVGEAVDSASGKRA